MALLVVGLPAAWGFALIGPVANGGDSWQTQSLGYNPQATIDTLSTGPKNIGEEYRQNKSVLVYAYDASFLDFFGLNGAASVDQAFTIMTAAFTNNPTGVSRGLDGYSVSLQEFPLNSQHMNYEALGLGLTDIKSYTLWALVEQMGLAWPERYVWDLHNAYLPTTTPPSTCPADEYFEVVQRNYPVDDSVVVPLQNNPYANTLYSPYVNDTLYTFEIFYWPNCTRPGSSRAQYDYLVEPVAVDPYADQFTSVAGTGNLLPGGFYTGLTRDDVAGLRYLLTANNPNFETPAAGSVLQTTNVGPTQVITSSDLHALLLAAQTNAPANIPGLFPGVVVGTSSNYFAVICTITTNATIPSQAYGAPYPNNFGALVLKAVTNCAYQQFYVTSFANIITNGNLRNTTNVIVSGPGITLNYSSKTVVSNVTTSLTPAYGQPYPPAPVTNTTASSTTLNMPSGEYLVIPAGACGFNILSELALPPVLTTNSTTSATNANGFVDTVSQVTSFTPHQFLVQPINCVDSTPAAGLYEGIKKVQFVRANFDSLLGQSFQPVTNFYTMTLVTNSQEVVQKFQRVVTQPDILLSANDEPLTTTLPTYNAFSRSITFDQANVLPNLAGPGTITSPATFAFNKAGNLFLNGPMSSFGITTNSRLPYLNELTQSPYGVIWASFDARTNDPVVYPNGTSIQNLVNQMLIHVTPPAGILPDGSRGAAYAPITLTTAGGGAFLPPFTWSAAGLPPGQVMSSGGRLSGTPTQAGTFDFTVQLTDSLGRSVYWNYQITIH